ncbi:MAG: cytochrome P450, partial [Burkholderiales bacterium]|nr:cytochrome P450 [Burkholderiales bacterium]
MSSTKQSPLRPPGPKTPWFGLPLLREMRRDYLGFMQRTHQAHGDIAYMRHGPEHAYDLFSPELMREALVDNAEHFIRWERGIEVFAEAFGQSVLVTEGDTWKRQRRMLTPVFSARHIAGYGALMTQAAERALNDTVPSQDPSALVDIEALMARVTMEVIMRVLFSSSAQNDARDAATATQILSASAISEMYWPFSVPTWMPWPGNTKKRCGFRTLRGLVNRHIDERKDAKKPDAPTDDLLAILLAARDEHDPTHGLSDTELRDQCMVLFQAGHETSATALVWWARLVAEDAGVSKKIQRELDDVLQGREPTATDAPRLDYLQATIKEAMRLYPPVAALMSRRAVRDVRIGERTIPRGSLVRIAPWVSHHDARWFPDPESFRPERFVASAESPPRGAWMPFGAGPRVCI